MNSNITVNIDPQTFAGGAFIGKLNAAIAQVISNIRDENTDAAEKREITVKLVFRPDKERRIIHTTVGTAVKLAPAESVGTVLTVEEGVQPDELAVFEYDGEIAGQMRREGML